jgi:hypothetical protein
MGGGRLNGGTVSFDKGDEDAFMENYHEGEYDLDFDLTRDKGFEDESEFQIIEE